MHWDGAVSLDVICMGKPPTAPRSCASKADVLQYADGPRRVHASPAPAPVRGSGTPLKSDVGNFSGLV